MLGPREPGIFEVLPENWQIVTTFIACETQWVIHSTGVRIGINYPALESIMRMTDIADTASVFAGVRLMENESLKILSKAQ